MGCPTRGSSFRSRFFGGSTNCWGGWSRPLDAQDLGPRSWLEESGWPLSAEELRPYYDRATALLQLGSFDYDPGLLDQLGGTYAGQLNTGPTVGTHVLRFSPPTRFGALYRSQVADARNIRCLLHANAAEIETDADASRAMGVRVATLGGRTFCVEARYVVLAAGGIENPRLMLLSTKATPSGVGNANDLVGRFFMDHPARYLGVSSAPGLSRSTCTTPPSTTTTAISRSAARRSRPIWRFVTPRRKRRSCSGIAPCSTRRTLAKARKGWSPSCD